MARNDSYPSRGVDSSVRFDLGLFARKLLRALDPQGLSGNTAAPEYPGGGDFSRDWLSCSDSVFGVNYLLSHIFSKYDDGKPSSEKKEATWHKFFEAETRCSVTNSRIAKRLLSESWDACSVLHVAEQKISRLLGEFCWDRALDGANWGPGATFSLPRRKSDAIYKFGDPIVTTAGNSDVAGRVVSRSPLWLESVLSHARPWHFVPGNRVCTVPKNWKTDRTIAIEPNLNIFVQKGIGSVIRSKLRRVGIDLDDQRNNQAAAFAGSIGDGLATLDLSMASDTVSYELVRQLIRPDWFEALEQCRSPVGVLPSGAFITYEKFSSMGNGYTFELETLIFWGLCSAVIDLMELEDRRVLVYGDDIVIPEQAYDRVVQALDFFGFKTNDNKSFSHGPFRESCGKHYFSGSDVTPFYVRRPVDRLTELFLLHNNLYRWCDRNRWNTLWDRDEMRKLLKWIRGHAPSEWRRPRLPDGYGDGAFIGTFDECLPRPAASSRKTLGWEGFEVKVISQKARTRESASIGRLVKSLFFLERKDVSRHSLTELSEWFGGLSLSPRAVISKIIVQQYPGTDPFGPPCCEWTSIRMFYADKKLSRDRKSVV